MPLKRETTSVNQREKSWFNTNPGLVKHREWVNDTVPSLKTLEMNIKLAHRKTPGHQLLSEFQKVYDPKGLEQPGKTWQRSVLQMEATLHPKEVTRKASGLPVLRGCSGTPWHTVNSERHSHFQLHLGISHCLQSLRLEKYSSLKQVFIRSHWANC